ncbi:MAG TPA: ribosomal RNA small subunit methyltransferase A [Candidatus Aenigmarchaeota archaeon]|nr:ribosomal RNA small subunit methyltransferase A [Candidatus Aenigmarchaeota archaeon]
MKNASIINVRGMFRTHGIRPNRALGQHFLTDRNLLQREVEYANISRKDMVLEIGPGIGNLTELLAKRAKSVIAIEKDLRFRNILSELQAKYDNIRVVYGDALQVKFPRFDKMVSNLPFKIALPLTFKILEHDFEVAVLLCQERLARRMCALPGRDGYSRLSVQIRRNADVDFLEVVPKNKFFPPPKVDGALVRIRRTPPKFDVPSEEFFKELLKFMFSQRNKTVRQAVMALKSTGVPKESLLEVLSRIGRILHKKVREIKPREFGSMAWAFWEELGDLTEVFRSFFETHGLYKHENE